MKLMLKAACAAMLLCPLLALGCNEEENQPTDEGQVTDVHQETDTATNEDVIIVTDTDQGDANAGTDAADTNQATDANVGEDANVDGDANQPTDSTQPDVISNVVLFDECPTQGNIVMPWVSEFDIGATMAANGWEIIAPQAIASGMWDLAFSADVFGTNLGLYALFMGEEGRVARTGLVSNCLDTSICGASSNVTLQWRMQYKHADPTKMATLKAVVVNGTDLDSGTVVWSATVTQDLAYDLYSVELPAEFVNVNGIRLALVLEFPDESALVTQSWSIDHLVIACGRANHLVKTILYTCPEGETACTPTSATQIGDPIPTDNPVSMTLDYCAHNLVVLCGYDEDASAMTWQTYGFPGSMLDAAPSAKLGAMSAATGVGVTNGCETLPAAVANVCGTPATEVNGYFYCATEVRPNCDYHFIGIWPVRLVLRDEYDHAGVAPLHSPLESLTPVTIEATRTPE